MFAQDRSPFYHDWDDQNEAERYQMHAKELLDQIRILQQASRTGHMDYGKWLIASLLAVHGGSIYAISSLKKDVSTAQLHELVLAASWNLGGIVFVLFAAFFAWWNFQFAEIQYFKWGNPAMLYRYDHFPSFEVKRNPVGATLLLAAMSGILSGYAFIVSSVTIVNALQASL